MNMDKKNFFGILQIISGALIVGMFMFLVVSLVLVNYLEFAPQLADSNLIAIIVVLSVAGP